jgi:putative transposase
VTTACFRAPGSPVPVARSLRIHLAVDTTEASTGIPDTNPLERLNKEVKRRADVVGIFPNEASIIRLIGAVLLEQNDEWQLQHRYMQVEAMAELTAPVSEAETRQIAA